jgi:hypothetical protein
MNAIPAHLCDCSRPAVFKIGRDYVCARCFEIDGNYSRARDYPREPRTRVNTPERLEMFRRYNAKRVKKSDPAATPQPNEITMKEWHKREAARLGITPHNHTMRVHRGSLPGPENVRVVNARVKFVTISDPI